MARGGTRNSMHFGFGTFGDEPKKKPEGPKPKEQPAAEEEAQPPASPAERPKPPSNAPAEERPLTQARSLDPGSDLAKRVTMFREEVNVDPRNLDLLYRFGDTLIEARQLEEAKGVYQRILKLEPASSLARGKLREICKPQEFENLKLPPPVVIFWHDFGGLLKYPFAGDGVYIIVLGAIFQSVFLLGMRASAALGAAAFMGSVVCLILSALVWGYLLTYYFKVVQSTASGEAEPPDWPPFSAGDCVLNMIRFLLLLCYWALPVVLVLAIVSGLLGSVIPPMAGGAIVLLAALPCAIAALIWMPMAYLALAIYGDVGVFFDPRMIFGSIVKTFGDYVIAWFSLAALWIVTSIVTGMFNLAIYVFALVLSAGDNLLYIILQAIVIVVVGSFTGLYTWMVSSRLMGLFFRQAQRNLGWFRPID